MDWFHCARCFRQDGTQFTITSCGHILCEGCGDTGPCPVCATACRYLPLSQQASAHHVVPHVHLPLPTLFPSCFPAFFPSFSRPHAQQMCPEVKVFFKNPVAIALKHLAHVTQVWRFQQAQAQLLVDLHRDRARQMQAELEKAREELREMRRELDSLRQENAELRRIQLSPGWRWSSRSSTPRPSPTQSVTPQPRRQLSSRVVSRLAPLEPPRSHSTPGWQAGVAYRDSRTTLASSVGLCPAAGEGRALPVGQRSTAIKDKQRPLKGSKAPGQELRDFPGGGWAQEK
ncbi:RING finger protein 212B isoform X2 [Poecile atricapillus]|uniref:RING finger protein 212B isoform X2 n=1 Tax=Poecile atricapillus TaxID=48891 RepID=UPI002738D4F0|nr:RING finger protein 212B isoform X2 [Poecile atricapillus]